MTTTSRPSSTAAPAGPRLKRSLGTPSLLLFGLAYMLPLAVFTTYGLVTETTGGHLAGAYFVTTIAMLFTAGSYASMVRAYPVAGSAYTYTQRTFGRHLGFLTGWTLLLDYLALPLLNYLVIGIYLNAAFPAVPAWVWVVGSVVVVTLLNVIGITLVSSANLALVGVQIVFIVVFVATGIAYLSGGATVPNLLDPFFSGNTTLGGIAAGAAILALAFLGFDAVSTLSEEAKDARKSIPRAIILCTLVGGLLFIVTAYVAGLVFPDFTNFTDTDSAPLDVMTRIGGGALFTFFTAAYIAGSFASAMTSQASVARILFAMGRDGQLPRRVFAAIHPRFKTPWLSVLIVGVVGLIGALLLPLDVAASVISFGALVAFSFVNLAVIKHYLIDQHERGTRAVLAHLVAPLIGFALTVWLWTSLSLTTFIAGGIWVLIGVVLLAILTSGFRRKPPAMDFSEEDPAPLPEA
ncbi:Amino acid transporter [Leifsonia sp. 98AMF]|uniref:APC family permease n=1 Tax=unclassified Leifsonia TaxID=2663824 RepID=UPI000879D79C|nr:MULTISPECIES: APC family permease [unclassified Leifsonia]SDH13388.1 Amino acid transporter [Leifsonia sp. 197AMF]SDJ25226.1 Amino acid transporter [Leifsonia sp. 466MF]SDK57523.1 Amino acid transporter [Leifsonia sp. 157MF]SDN47007.1 Amino acid transporter [Leifsonia sp. 509MF]SEN63811.1 Amino acid transporter [Leifsonia sp. 467MF]